MERNKDGEVRERTQEKKKKVVLAACSLALINDMCLSVWFHEMHLDTHNIPACLDVDIQVCSRITLQAHRVHMCI